MKPSRFNTGSQTLLALVVVFATCELALAADFYASDQTGDINRISSAGVVTTYASIPGTSDLPEGLALGLEGTLYIANAGQSLLWKIPPGGTLTPFASPGTQRYSYGLTFGPNGNLFAALVGLGAGQIAQITTSGVVSPFASLPAGSEPFGLAFDRGGDLFVSDAHYNNVYRITPGGTVSIFTSIPGSLYLMGLTFDNSGDLFVADYGGPIYRITPGGNVSTFTTLPSTAGLRGLLYDDGYLYVAEQNRNVIGRISAGLGLADVIISDFAQMHAPQFLVAIPEPTALALLGVGMLGLSALRRARR